MKLCKSFIIIFFLLNISINASSNTEKIRSNFQNKLMLPPGINSDVNQSSSAAFFNGHIGKKWVNHFTALTQSSFGQTFSKDIPSPEFIKNTLNSAKQLMDEAFVYKKKLYKKEYEDSQSYIIAQFKDIHNYWDDDNRKKAQKAADIIKGALCFAHYDKELRRALLDFYYDMAVADLAIAKEKNKEAIQSSLGIIPASPGNLLINKEISLLEATLELYRKSIKGYFELLNDSLGVKVSNFDPNAPEDISFGYYIFKQEVPERFLNSPLLIDKNDNWVIPNNSSSEHKPYEILKGYKDLVLLFNIQKNYVKCASLLAKRYIQRSADNDIEKAKKLIGNTQQSSYIEGNILLNIFPSCENSDNCTNLTGLSESIKSWRHELTEMSFLHTYINGEINILGFSDDFLVLAQSSIPGDSNAKNFDSFDCLKAYLFQDFSNKGPLQIAIDDLKKAKNDYDNFRDRNDQLAIQFSAKNELYNERLRQIIGVAPGESGYYSPFENIGSELYLQSKKIDIALNQIKINNTNVENLKKQIEIEVWRRGQEKNINNAIEQIFLYYGEEQVSLTEDIADINADQAFANNMAQAFASVSVGISESGPSVNVSGGIISYAINAFFQKDREKRKGRLQAEKEKLNARERADIHALNDDLLDVNSKARIRKMMLQMNIFALKSIEQCINLEQEYARMTALITEKNSIELRKEENNELLAERYFADPSHRLLKNSSFVCSELSFQNAQKWLYITIRALEYKWNQKFTHFYNNMTYKSDTIFSLRNAQELEDMFYAMNEFNKFMELSNRNDDAYKIFSLKEDFLGYRNDKYRTKYLDPVTHELVDADKAFHSYLSQESLYIEPDDPDNKIPDAKVLRLKFNTAYSPESGGFFMRNRWLEKIKYLKVKICGGYSNDNNNGTLIDGYLKYAGLAFIRNMKPGIINPNNPYKIIDETTTYSTIYWSYDPDIGSWQSMDGFSSSIQIWISNHPEIPLTVKEIDTFKEYSIATSEWVLDIAVQSKNSGIELINVSEITDIEIHFYFYFRARNMF